MRTEMIRSCCTTTMISGTPNTMSESARSALISQLKNLTIAASNARRRASSLNPAVSIPQSEPPVKPTRPGLSPPYQTPVNVSQSISQYRFSENIFSLKPKLYQKQYFKENFKIFRRMSFPNLPKNCHFPKN